MQSLHNINLDNYGYSMGGAATGNTPFQDLIMNQRGAGAATMMHAMHMGESGLSPPYSNQSPPHSVQSNLALSPQGYIGKCGCILVHFVYFIKSILLESIYWL